MRKPSGGIGGAWRSLPRPVRAWGPFLVAATLAILYPYYEESLGDWFPSVATATTMTVFVMMALGLNVVVGYAGLLDLGYVAFYAAGAYVVGLVRLRPLRAGQHPLRRCRRPAGRARHPHRRRG